MWRQTRPAARRAARRQPEAWRQAEEGMWRQTRPAARRAARRQPEAWRQAEEGMWRQTRPAAGRADRMLARERGTTGAALERCCDWCQLPAARCAGATAERRADR